MSLGSSDEMQVLLSFAKDLGYIDEERYIKGKEEYKTIAKMLQGMIREVTSEI